MSSSTSTLAVAAGFVHGMVNQRLEDFATFARHVGTYLAAATAPA